MLWWLPRKLLAQVEQVGVVQEGAGQEGAVQEGAVQEGAVLLAAPLEPLRTLSFLRRGICERSR